MFVTDKFVYLHLPKTGGTFVAAILTKIHKARGDDAPTIWIDPQAPADAALAAAGPAVRLMLTGRDQHGVRKDIPARYAGLPVVGTVRSPYDRYVSQYEFAWWRLYPDMFGPIEDITRRYPQYPDLTFEEFVELANTNLIAYRDPVRPDDTPGFHTQRFVQQFFRAPEGVYPRLSDDAAALAVRAEAFREVRFLDQTRLNEDLHDFLLDMGYAPAEIAFVREADRIWPPEGGRGPEQEWASYYSPDLKAFVRHRERRLFEWFPQFDV